MHSLCSDSGENWKLKGVTMADDLSIWTVYEQPTDYPDKFVARRWVTAPLPCPTSDVLVADDLDSIRALLPRGLTMLPRQTNDDQAIVESWI